LERPDLLLDAGDDAHRAHAVPGHDHAADRLLAAFDQRGCPERVAHLHVGDLAQVDGHAVLGADHDPLNVGDGLDESQASDDRPRPGRLEHVAAHVAVTPHDRVDDRRDGNPPGPEPVRVYIDLVLAHHAAHAGDLGHAGYRVELIADEPILNRAQIAEGVARALDRVPEDVADARGVGAEGRHHARRQGFGEQLQALEHARACEVEVGGVLEDHVDHRETERRG
jgi:hypothetical protein